MTRAMAEEAFSATAFGATAPFRIGVEEELFLVDPHTHEIALRTDDLLAQQRGRRFQRGQLVGEMCDGLIELVTPARANADGVVDALRELRLAALRFDAVRLLGTGLHPTAPFGDVHHRRGRHYDAVAADLRGLFDQSAYCGVHIHVGMPDAETAIVAYNGMRKWVPLLQALGANSPFWHGRDSGLASCRLVRLHNDPRTGLPRAFADWADYRESMLKLVDVAGLDGPGSLWWDLRPHPVLGTLEVRVPDAQSSLEDLRGLVALVHCLAYHEAITADRRHPSKEVLDEACFQAIRDGLDARLPFADGRIHHAQGLARYALDLVAGYAHALGCAAALGALDRLLAEGNGAQRQRRVFAGGGMRAVTTALVRETCRVDRRRPTAAVSRSTASATGAPAHGYSG
jgi:glutamate---cysteine ligase / carboxylate-amine ligase